MPWRDARPHPEAISALYASDCGAGCADGIKVGDLIHCNSEGEWQHVECDGDYAGMPRQPDPGLPGDKASAYDKPTKYQGTDTSTMGY